MNTQEKYQELERKYVDKNCLSRDDLKEIKSDIITIVRENKCNELKAYERLFKKWGKEFGEFLGEIKCSESTANRYQFYKEVYKGMGLLQAAAMCRHPKMTKLLCNIGVNAHGFTQKKCYPISAFELALEQHDIRISKEQEDCAKTIEVLAKYGGAIGIYINESSIPKKLSEEVLADKVVVAKSVKTIFNIEKASEINNKKFPCFKKSLGKAEQLQNAISRGRFSRQDYEKLKIALSKTKNDISDSSWKTAVRRIYSSVLYRICSFDNRCGATFFRVETPKKLWDRTLNTTSFKQGLRDALNQSNSEKDLTDVKKDLTDVSFTFS